MKPDSVILVVDDDVDIVEMITLLLDLHGYRALGESSATTALRRLQEGLRPALMLVDLRMPGLDGAELIRAVHGDAALARTPIAILSGEIHCRQEAVSLGVEACLTKPVELEDLLATARRFADPQAAARNRE